MTARRLLLPVAFTLPVVFLVVLFQRPMASVEDAFTAWKYQLRGEERADTNIILVYVDNDAVASLGWPVRRNFYALMIKALTDLKVKAIGIDVQFEVPVAEYPEYDDLLAGVIGASQRVVLTSYFRTTDSRLQNREELHLPLAKFLQESAGVGHVNLAGRIDIPVFLRNKDTLVPSLGFELLRVYTGGRINLPLPGDNIVKLNFPGRISAFTTYPFLEVLKSYDDLHADRTPLIPVMNFREKVVIVGVIGEGRSAFFDTPVDLRFPAMGLHAVFLDNALRSGFLASAPNWLVYFISIVMGVLCSASILLLAPQINRVVVFIALGVPLILSVILFLTHAYILPIVPVLSVGLITGAASLLYKHRQVRAQVESLTAEKESIVSQLRDKEAKVAVLERELLDTAAARSADRTYELNDEIRRLKAEIRSLSSRADDMEVYQEGPSVEQHEVGQFEEIVYENSGKMAEAIGFVSKIANSDAPVLILGESGTGKELIARAIHKRSDRAQKSFLPVNCGALSENLLESELFGHEKGAFTGAVKDKLGRFELAHEGTIFLDEIGEVSEGFQLRLLRVLQEGEFERVGGTKTIKVNVRVLAATNKDLKEQVKLKRFREDLYYRLNVLTVALPPLRERQGDIPLLIQHFLTRNGTEMRVSKNVMDLLLNYQWPGNIRELESTVKRGVLLAKAENRTMISMRDLSEEIFNAVQTSLALDEQVLELVREKGFSRSSVSETANELGGLNRGTVAEYLRGQCLKAFADHGFDIENTVRYISLSADSAVNDRVRKKLHEYLSNLSEVINTSQPWETSRASLKPKTKNLPQRYHTDLEKVAEAYFRGLWRTPDRA